MITCSLNCILPTVSTFITSSGDGVSLLISFWQIPGFLWVLLPEQSHPLSFSPERWIITFDMWHKYYYTFIGSWTVIWIMGLGLVKGFVWLELIEYCLKVNEILPLLLIGTVERGQGMIWERGEIVITKCCKINVLLTTMVLEHLY